MTLDHDFDRIARAWLDLGPNEAPDRAVDAVLQAVETVPQVRRPIRWPIWRSSHMSRFPLLAALAGVIAISVGLLLFAGGSRNPTPLPSPSTTPTPTAAAATQGPPDELVGGWTGGTKTLLFGALDGNEVAPDFTVSGPAFSPNLRSAVEVPEPGVIRMTLAGASPQCAKGDVGTYRWSTSTDRQWLTMEAIDDACADRRDLLHTAWYQRDLSVDSHGGPGIITSFLPYIELTLPVGAYTGTGATKTDTIQITAPNYTFQGWKDLDGFVDPCDINAGRLDLDPGMDAFLAYLNDDPRFAVTSQEEFEIDGHRAVEVLYTIGDSITPPCWDFDGNSADKTGVLTWIPGASTGGFWNARTNSQGMAIVTEYDGIALVFEPVKPSGGTWEIDRDVLATVRFHDELPAPPAS